MIKPPYLTVVWVPFLAGNLSDTRVEQLGSQDGSGSLSEEEWFDAAGEPWRFFQPLWTWKWNKPA